MRNEFTNAYAEEWRRICTNISVHFPVGSDLSPLLHCVYWKWHVICHHESFSGFKFK